MAIPTTMVQVGRLAIHTARLMNTAYLQSIFEHTNEHIEALDELSELLPQRSLTFHERNSAQRSIQVVVEACIGLSKHTLKSAQKQVLGDAASTALKALELLPTSAITPAELKGAIGMRNAIVHDYLNMDWALLEAVLKQQDYHKLKAFIQAASTHLMLP